MEKHKNTRVCNCSWKVNSKALNFKQMELQIALIGGNTSVAEKFKSDPDVNYSEYNSMGPKLLKKAINCVLKKD